MSKTISLFPTPITIHELNRPLTNSEIGFITKSLESLQRNHQNSTTTSHFVLEDKSMKKLKSFCLNAVHDFSKNVMEVNDGDLKITQSWINLSKKTEYHHMHNHSNSIWSGVFYIQTHEDDEILFYNNQFFQNQIYLNELNHNIYNSQIWHFPIKQGQLILFPSVLRHSAPPTKCDNRISLSFNTFFTKTIGEDKKLNLIPN